MNNGGKFFTSRVWELQRSLILAWPFTHTPNSRTPNTRHPAPPAASVPTCSPPCRDDSQLLVMPHVGQGWARAEQHRRWSRGAPVGSTSTAEQRGAKSPHKTMASHIHCRSESSKHQLGPAHVPGHYWDFILSSLMQPKLHPAGSRAALWCRSAEQSRLLAAGRAGAARWGKKRQANASPAWLHHAASGMWREGGFCPFYQCSSG